MSNRGVRSGGLVDGTNWKLPSIVTAFGNGTNTVSATAFAVLPTTTCTAAITNPHPFDDLLVVVDYGAWMTGAASTDVRACLDVSGSIVVLPGVGGGGPIGWGEVLYTAATGIDQHHAMCTYELPASATAATFKMFAMKVGAGSPTVDYPTIRITPIRYLPV